MSGKYTNRRDFLAGSMAAAVTVVPRHVLGGAGQNPPSEKLNIAGIGVGGMGKNNLRQLESENIVALCDVDREYAAPVFKRYPKAKVYTDFRKMLEMKDLVVEGVMRMVGSDDPFTRAAIEKSLENFDQVLEASAGMVNLEDFRLWLWMTGFRVVVNVHGEVVRVEMPGLDSPS